MFVSTFNLMHHWCTWRGICSSILWHH